MKGEKYKLTNFTDYHNSFSTHADRKARGGVSCFLKNELVPLVTEVNRDSPDHILVRFSNGNIVFSSYIAPIDSPFCDPTDFTYVANAFVPTDNKCLVFGGGDLNSRIGDLPQERPPPNFMYDTNCDDFINEHGKEVMLICNSFSCFVLNNLHSPSKHFPGDFTFQKSNRKAQNDLLLANLPALSTLKNFVVHKEGWNPSDHSPVSVECQMVFTSASTGLNASKDILTEGASTASPRPKKIQKLDVDWDAFKSLTESDFESYSTAINNLSNNVTIGNLDSVVTSVSKSLTRSANLASTKKVSSNQEVRDTSIESPLHNIATEMLHNYRRNGCSSEEYEEARNNAVSHLQQTSSAKERKAWAAVLNESDSKTLWEKIDWKGTINEQYVSELPDLEDLRDQFMMKSETTDDSTLFSDVKQNQHEPILDNDIEIDEITKAHSQLKEGKSTADGWTKNMVTSVPLCLLLVFQLIYNCILKHHVYPTNWRTTIVNAIFKNKGSRLLAMYYRGISIVYMMAKIFDILLLNRFKQWFLRFISDQQTAYQEKLSSADNVFLLRCLIAYARKVKKKLFIISIDFDGAFDRVCRSVLIKKLCRFGAGTIFVTCIASMYLKTDNIIFQGSDHITYTLFAGIKQGLPLSPLLFLFYINDIFSFFQSLYKNSLNSIFEIIHVLVHADDATFIASARVLAISKLCNLLAYCKLNWIIPQFSKCEFIVINGDDEDKEPLPFGDKFLFHVSHLNLLGSHLSATGKLEAELKLHFEARYKSCAKFLNFLRANQLAPLIVKVKVLKACVVNSLLYNCETFGHCVTKELEKIYIKLIKRTFDLRTNTPTLTTYIETGFLPIKALILARQFKFFTRYKNGTTGEVTPRTTLFNRLMDDPTEYSQHYLNLIDNYDSVEEIYNESITSVKQKIRDLASRDDKYKYTIYTELNPELEKSPFVTNPHPLSREIIKFRLGSHSLPIETGRWARKVRADRVCTDCHVLGDERHALFVCSKIARNDLVLPYSLGDIWKSADVFTLFARLKKGNVFD